MNTGATLAVAGLLGVAAGLGTYFVTGFVNLPDPPSPKPGENGMIMMKVVDGLVDQDWIKYRPMGGGADDDDEDGGAGPFPGGGPTFMIRYNSIYCYITKMNKLYKMGPYPDEYHCP